MKTKQPGRMVTNGIKHEPAARTLGRYTESNLHRLGVKRRAAFSAGERGEGRRGAEDCGWPCVGVKANRGRRGDWHRGKSTERKTAKLASWRGIEGTNERGSDGIFFFFSSEREVLFY